MNKRPLPVLQPTSVSSPGPLRIFRPKSPVPCGTPSSISSSSNSRLNCSLASQSVAFVNDPPVGGPDHTLTISAHLVLGPGPSPPRGKRSGHSQTPCVEPAGQKSLRFFHS